MARVAKLSGGRPRPSLRLLPARCQGVARAAKLQAAAFANEFADLGNYQTPPQCYAIRTCASRRLGFPTRRQAGLGHTRFAVASF